MVIILLFFLIISFLFIPFKITLYFSKEDYYIKLYRLNILSKEGGLLKRFISKSKPKAKKKFKKTTTRNKSFIKVSFKLLYHSLSDNIYKPKLHFFANLDYSLSDAANTAILYGILTNLNYITYKILSIFFNLSQFNFDLNPEFTDNSLLEFTISSIIYFNLAQIIYILFLVFKSRKKSRR